MPKPRFLALDGIRGLAIIAVLLTHAANIFESGPLTRRLSTFMQFGWTGVDLFFVLSGFLITGILIDTKPAVNRGVSFYARRILRIFPIYYLTLGLVMVAWAYSPWIRSVTDFTTWPDRLSYLLYFQNVAPLWHHGEAHYSFLSHFWSLAVEEQFYFVWPLLVWSLTPKSIYRLCGIALCLTLLLRVILGHFFGFGAWMTFLTVTRADGLLVGSGLAALLAERHRVSNRLLFTSAAAGSLALLVIAAIGHQQLLYGGPYMSTFGFSALAILFGVLIAFSLQFETSLLARFVRVGWLRSFGRYSYGIYVFHIPIYFLLERLLETQFSAKLPLPNVYAFPYLALLITVPYCVAWLSFNLFEQRFLRLKRNFEPVFAGATPPTPVEHHLLELDHNVVLDTSSGV